MVFFFQNTCGGTSNTYLVSPSKNITCRNHCFGDISCLGMGEITKLISEDVGKLFF